MSYDKTKPSEYDGLFQKAADEHGVSYDLLRKLAFNESGFNPKAKSPTGPLGLMQFTKGTAAGLGLKVTGGDDDERFVNRVLVPKFQEKYDDVKIVKYATMEKKKL
jgi:membrane-bound lytic murein transglycosylase MltF